MSKSLFPGCLAIIDTSQVPEDVKTIPVWNKVNLEIIDSFKERGFRQVDRIRLNDIVVVVAANHREEFVTILTPSGKMGVTWTGHLRVLK